MDKICIGCHEPIVGGFYQITSSYVCRKCYWNKVIIDNHMDDEKPIRYPDAEPFSYQDLHNKIIMWREWIEFLESDSKTNVIVDRSIFDSMCAYLGEMQRQYSKLKDDNEYTKQQQKGE